MVDTTIESKEAFRRRVASLLLSALEDTRFALTGAGALIEHGVIARPTQDIDLFTTPNELGTIPEAVSTLQSKCPDLSISLDIVQQSPDYARFTVIQGPHSVEVDLAVDWRGYPAVSSSIGPVLDVRDAVGNKVSALYSRGEVRDYLDVAAALLDGRWSADDLLFLGEHAELGFDREMMAERLNARYIPHTEDFRRYDIPRHAEGQMMDALTALRFRCLGDDYDLDAAAALRRSSPGRTAPLSVTLNQTREAEKGPRQLRSQEIEGGQDISR